jgi:hypothetical protein
MDNITRPEFHHFAERVYDKLDSIDSKVDEALGLEVRIAVLETQMKQKAPAPKHVKWGTVGTFIGGFILELAHAFMKK